MLVLFLEFGGGVGGANKFCKKMFLTCAISSTHHLSCHCVWTKFQMASFLCYGITFYSFHLNNQQKYKYRTVMSRIFALFCLKIVDHYS